MKTRTSKTSLVNVWTSGLFLITIFGLLLMPVAAGQEVLTQERIDALLEFLQETAIPITGDTLPNVLIEEAAGHPYVLLGEASHGTSEYYTYRADISMQLIQDHGFSFIAVEGDWDACWEVNAYVKDLPRAAQTAEAALAHFNRWPPWMWNNREVLELVRQLRSFNDSRPRSDRVGFYGIDVYGLEGSLQAVLDYVAEVNPEKAPEILAAYDCLMPYREDGAGYARRLALGGNSCEDAVRWVLEHLREEADNYKAQDAKAYFAAKQHAWVVKNAERHYRAAAKGGADSWNSRAEHFAQTVERLMAYHGNDAKGIVWAHNTHIGDARATAMGLSGRLNIGQILREQHGREKVYAVGFGTHRGTVLAGRAWGQAMETMTVPEGIPGSWEYLLHRAGISNAVLFLEPELREGLLDTFIGHRAIGVVYQPERENPGNYVPTRIADRYDAFIFIEETQALDSLAP